MELFSVLRVLLNDEEHRPTSAFCQGADYDQDSNEMVCRAPATIRYNTLEPRWPGSRNGYVCFCDRHFVEIAPNVGLSDAECTAVEAWESWRGAATLQGARGQVLFVH
jgi:hypothetical protein